MKNVLTILAFVSVTTAHAQYKTNLFQSQSAITNGYTSLAGWHGGLQVNANYQNFFPGTGIGLPVYSISADYYSPKLNGSFGFNGTNVNYYHQSQKSLEAFYTQRFQIFGSTVSPSASISYHQHNLNTDVFANSPYYDSLQADYGPLEEEFKFLGLNAGASIVYKNWFGATQFSFLNRPDVGIYANSLTKTRVHYSFIAGWNKTLGEWTLSPSIEFNGNGYYSGIMTSFNASWKNINAGVKYILSDQLGFAAGYDIAGKVRLSYAYSFTTSSLSTHSYGSHFVGLRWWFLKEQRNEYRLLNNLGIL